MELKKSYISKFKYACNICNYSSCYSKDFNKHLLTKKHKELNGTILEVEKVLFCSHCNSPYKTKAGLWKHRQKCKPSVSQKLNELDKDDLIITLLKQNAELIKGQQDIIVKLSENGINSHNTIHTNSHNKAFNLNFFLNETCKNAMNITDFVDSIKLQLSDLMAVGELGYVEGMTKIIVKNLNNLDETERPVHCTDKKRETMYIKDEGEWCKEDDNKTKLKKAINRVANKNIKLLPTFREKYPEYSNASSKTSDIHDKLVIEVMDTDDDKKDKIIHRISKATVIKDTHAIS